MKKILIADRTLCAEKSFSFKEKLEVMRQLEKLNVDAVMLPAIENEKADVLLVRTASAFVKNSVLSVAAGADKESIDKASSALSGTEKPMISITLPVSTVGMEYSMHMKAPKMLAWIGEAVAYAASLCGKVEFCAVDATRADGSFLEEAIKAAVGAGAAGVTLCDNACDMLPDDFAAFVEKYTGICPITVDVSNRTGLAAASGIMAVRCGATGVVTSLGGDAVPTDVFAGIVKNCTENYGISSGMKYTEMNRITRQIKRVTEPVGSETRRAGAVQTDAIRLDANDDLKTVSDTAKKLGYDLSEEDTVKVYKEVVRVAEKKSVGAAEFDAIISSTALQVPDTYKLESYVINSGNIISTSAQVTLSRDGEVSHGISIGDGPIDAAFRAIEQIIGHRYELDDFRIESATEGKEAVGIALVKLRSGGRVYSGNGISTDILGAGIRAYISAVNKITYEENNK